MENQNNSLVPLAVNSVPASDLAEDAMRFFQNEEFGKIRVLIKDGEPWFVAKDIVEALGYTESSLKSLGNLFKCVPDDWKGMNPFHTLGGKQEMLILSEQGFYFFLNRSDKPKALPLQKWVAGDILPSLRKTGSYSIPNDPTALGLPNFNDPFEAAEAWIKEGRERVRVERCLADAVKERDQAIKARSWIGNKREATAMATAAKAIKRNQKLTEENAQLKSALGAGGSWKLAKSIDGILDFFCNSKAMWSNLGKILTQISKEIRCEVKLSTAKKDHRKHMYHSNVILEFWKRVKEDDQLLAKYRITVASEKRLLRNPHIPSGFGVRHMSIGN